MRSFHDFFKNGKPTPRKILGSKHLGSKPRKLSAVPRRRRRNRIARLSRRKNR